jgi:hypothetical protein
MTRGGPPRTAPMRTIQGNQASPSVETADLEASSFLYSKGFPLLAHRHDGQRTIFSFQALPQDLADFYGPSGEGARKLLLARRTLLGLVHEGRR